MSTGTFLQDRQNLLDLLYFTTIRKLKSFKMDIDVLSNRFDKISNLSSNKIFEIFKNGEYQMVLV